MRHTIYLFSCILLLQLLVACSNKKFVPLYEGNIKPKETALLIVPLQIDVVFLDGKEIDITPPYKPLVNYRLPPGKHQIGFQYEDLHYDEFGNHDVIKSKVVLMEFSATTGQTYYIEFNKPQNHSEAKNIEKEFRVTLVQNNQDIAQSVTAAENLLGPSFFSKKPFPPETNELFEQDESSLYQSSSPPNANDEAIQHLKYWWQTASEQEKESFAKWITNN